MSWKTTSNNSTMARNNREILTGGKKYIQKKIKKNGVEEVVFDKGSRVEYLTGFHKRKLQRQKKAQETIKEQERLARIEERRKIREERQKDMEKQLAELKENAKIIGAGGYELEEEMGANEQDDEDWQGFDDKKEEEEAQDEDKYKGILKRKEVYKLDEDIRLDLPAVVDEETTVVVESLENPAITRIQNTNLEALAKANNVNLEKSDEILEESITRAKNYAVLAGVTKPPVKEKQKKKKFRYLSKAERRENNRKAKDKKRDRKWNFQRWFSQRKFFSRKFHYGERMRSNVVVVG